MLELLKNSLEVSHRHLFKEFYQHIFLERHKISYRLDIFSYENICCSANLKILGETKKNSNLDALILHCDNLLALFL